MMALTRRLLLGAIVALIAGGVLASTVAAAPGDLDPSFGVGGLVRTPIGDRSLAYAIGRQSDGKLVVAGCSSRNEPGWVPTQFAVARYDTGGNLDPSFGDNGIAAVSFPGGSSACVDDLAIRPDDSIVVAGRADRVTDTGSTQDFAIAQLAPDGQLDSAFGTDGRVRLHPGSAETATEANAIVLDPSGRAVIAGYAGTGSWPGVDGFAAVRIGPDGALDTSFGEGGEVILEMTETTPFFGFGPHPASSVADLVRYGDGRIALVGTAYDAWQDASDQYRYRLAIARLDSNGQLDPSFSGDGKLVTPVRELDDLTLGNAATLTSDGRLTVGLTYNHQSLVARFEPNGDADLTFGSGGSTVVLNTGSGGVGVQALRYQADGKLVVAGVADPPSDLPRFGVARLNANGEPDLSFGSNGIVPGPPFEPGEPWSSAYGYDLVLEPSGNIVVAGFATGQNGEPEHFALARYQGNPPPQVPSPPSDRDGDGVPDDQDQCPDVPGVAPTGCPTKPAPPIPSPPASRGLKVRAVGDSVTAAFGYYADGTLVPSKEILSIGPRCRPPNPPDGRCQSPNTVAYPAVWARSVGIPIRYPSFANYAITGATPKDWIEKDAPFRSKLDQVVAEDPTLVILTLGGNPLLTDFAFHPVGQWCMRTDWTGLQTRACVSHQLAVHKTVSRLTRVYSRLLDAPSSTIGVFLYHKTYPKTIPRRKLDYLFSELNSAVKKAVAAARRKRPNDADRLKLLTPPSFDAHQCGSSKPWVLSTEVCIHPNAAGHRAYARAISSQLFP